MALQGLLQVTWWLKFIAVEIQVSVTEIQVIFCQNTKYFFFQQVGPIACISTVKM